MLKRLALTSGLVLTASCGRILIETSNEPSSSEGECQEIFSQEALGDAVPKPQFATPEILALPLAQAQAVCSAAVMDALDGKVLTRENEEGTERRHAIFRQATCWDTDQYRKAFSCESKNQLLFSCGSTSYSVTTEEACDPDSLFQVRDAGLKLMEQDGPAGDIHYWWKNEPLIGKKQWELDNVPAAFCLLIHGYESPWLYNPEPNISQDKYEELTVGKMIWTLCVEHNGNPEKVWDALELE